MTVWVWNDVSSCDQQCHPELDSGSPGCRMRFRVEPGMTRTLCHPELDSGSLGCRMRFRVEPGMTFSENLLFPLPI